jgi:hypothetical protein
MYFTSFHFVKELHCFQKSRIFGFEGGPGWHNKLETLEDVVLLEDDEDFTFFSLSLVVLDSSGPK